VKIAQSIQNTYHEIQPLAQKLKEKVDVIMAARKKPSWHYISRVKTLQSYALKLETGRCPHVRNPEDLFACTIVVENLSEMKAALTLVNELFDTQYRKPKADKETHKVPWTFDFDDLRLYVKLKKVEYMPEGQIHDVVFELQVKTFLQHAWSIATHDLIYKTEQVSWPKQRVAFQIKAMLEQAEVAISGAEDLSKLPELDKQDLESKSLNDNLKFLADVFPEESLPPDLLRLAKIVNELCKTFKVALDDLRKIIDTETKAGRGSATLNLSPYAIILQSLINQEKEKFEGVFKNGVRLRNKVFVPSEIDLSSVAIEDSSKLIRS
jgi:ppGpp synthetase/RelA/SpoT-type nucleotidyltranferase